MDCRRHACLRLFAQLYCFKSQVDCPENFYQWSWYQWAEWNSGIVSHEMKLEEVDRRIGSAEPLNWDRNLLPGTWEKSVLCSWVCEFRATLGKEGKDPEKNTSWFFWEKKNLNWLWSSLRNMYLMPLGEMGSERHSFKREYYCLLNELGLPEEVPGWFRQMKFLTSTCPALQLQRRSTWSAQYGN